MNIASESWTLFDKEYSKTYLYDGDYSLLKSLSLEILEGKQNPRIADIGCGNCRLYGVLKSFEKPFLYEGFDISAPLVEAAKLSYSKNTNFSVSLIKDDFTGVPLNDMYDFSVSVHVAEICTSIEKLFYTLSTSSKNSAVLWYEFPRFEFTEMEIKKYVNHDFSHKEISTPYLRNKYSKSFYNHLLERFSLEVTKQISVSEKDTLVVYRRKSA